jgi:intein-encoded DNA endonuclease-like protein
MNNGKESCDSITIYSKKIKDMFPQHGEKEKHSRLIKLEPWQENIVDKYPKDFLRGLIHSDGCRFIPKTTQDQNARYQFTNVSTDIIQLYCSTLEKLNISYSISQKAIKGKMKHHSYNVLTQRKECVQILDTFIGPKT